ncbi:sensor histidine kinase YesM [Paenibacillus endophyticus]|uniref:Sensor histidine kinase YesM n=1 Tax=Paenibacillus endophyticus TaxID=1294268 RepID=A0A7W5GCD2_9BACL|nr:histidine kinase [Paenibacillus endophyticus]MBB3153897.1 sensor histidine kinase YesM [Paenibacillus endophyticus]
MWMKALYREWIGRFIFRKLNMGIGAALLLIFLLLGLVVYNNFYSILEKKEHELLSFRTEKLKMQMLDIMERFKYDSMSLYQNSNMQSSVYEMFLPDNIPSDKEDRKAIIEQNFIKNVMTHMLSRNPYTSAVIMYRLQDKRLFVESQQQKYGANPSFSYKSFFESFPKAYQHPYFGSSEQLLAPADRMLYIVNPIYNPTSIHPDQVYGYHLITLNTRMITNEFDNQSADYRLIIKQNGAVLLDSRPNGQSDWAASDDLLSRVTIDPYEIEMIGISYKSNLQSKLSDIAVRILSILGLSWLVCIIIIHLIQRFIVGRFNQMSKHFKKVQRNPFTPLMPISGEDEISDLMLRFNRMAQELQNHISQVYIAEIRKQNAEFIALKTQIHPHFLYNTLESLRMQAVISEQPFLAEKLYHLGRLYRWMLQPTDDLISVQEELAHTTYYLELLMLGKSNRIAIRVISEINLENCFMLKFTLQPVIENAIQHGQLEQYDDPIITVTVKREDHLLFIEIYNNGKNITAEEHLRLQQLLQTENTFPEQHLGLKNIHERIKHYYGNEYGLSLPEHPSETKSFQLTMIFPYKR